VSRSFSSYVLIISGDLVISKAAQAALRVEDPLVYLLLGNHGLRIGTAAAHPPVRVRLHLRQVLADEAPSGGVCRVAEPAQPDAHHDRAAPGDPEHRESAGHEVGALPAL